MRRPLLGLIATLALAAACAAPRPRLAPRVSAPSGPARAPLAGPARFLLPWSNDIFWARRGGDRELVVSAGARLEVAPSGEVLAAAWDADLATSGDVLVGAVAIPEAQGGGFVHWSRTRVFRSQTFTGPLEPVAMLDSFVRGARPGLASIVVLTDAGPRQLLPGSRQLAPIPTPGLLDLAALDATHAVRLDVFGRAAVTSEGGKSWIDLSPAAGIAVRGVAIGERDLFVDMAEQGRLTVRADGSLGPPESGVRYAGVGDSPQMFQIVWGPGRAGDRSDEWIMSYSDASPLAAAVASGAEVGDGTAVGVLQGFVMRVAFGTGKVVSASTEWMSNGLTCQTVRADEAVLFACTRERYQGYGAYVLRAEGGAAPVLERVLTDDGSFITDDEGALGYTGSCSVAPRFVDPEDPSRSGEESMESKLGPVFCVRRRGPGGAAEWVERAVDVSDGSTIAAWVPHRDGGASALLISNDPLPARDRGAPLVSSRAGVQIFRVPSVVAGASFRRPPSVSFERGPLGPIERRFAARADGSLDGWLSPTEDGGSSRSLGVTLTAEGRIEVHDYPPAVSAMVVSGDYGLSTSAAGALYETLDHGRSWRAAGASPVPPAAFTSGGCSALGCAFGPLVRLGWGQGALAPLIPRAVPGSAAGDVVTVVRRRPRALRLACAPTGSPEPSVPKPPAPASAKQVISTLYGDTIELVRDEAALDPAAGAPAPGAPGAPAPPGAVLMPPGMPLPPGIPSPPGAPSAPSGASASPTSAPPPPGSKLRSKPGSTPGAAPRPTPAVLRTQTLFVRPPFEPFASERRLNATNVSLTVLQRSGLVAPLLPLAGAGSSGEPGLLISGDTTELLLRGETLTSLLPIETRRAYTGDGLGSGGVLLPGNRALFLGEVRRRLSLEEHGRVPPLPPLYIGVERTSGRRRAMTLGRRDDGGTGVLVFDGPSPETVGVAPIDPKGGGVLALEKLAPWSSAVSADDPRCREDHGAYRAIVVLDPSGWFEIDAARLPGVGLARLGMAMVRWGKERVCLEALDLSATDARRHEGGSNTWRLVARWGEARRAERGAASPNASLRTSDLIQGLRCVAEGPREEDAR